MSEGSYSFDALKNSSYQLARLKQQAHAVRSMETEILRNAGIQSNHDVLELGCGPGFVSALLAELAHNGSLAVVEPNAMLLACVYDNVQHKPARGLQTYQAYGDALPIDNESRDFAYARFVLQHVPKPEDVVKEVARTLRSGGRFCIVDSDDGLVLFYPECLSASNVLAHAQTLQSEKGGDRFVGRKLQLMLHQAGFVKIKSHIVSLTSSEMPFELLFNILLGYKASLMLDESEIRQLFESLAKRVSSGEQMIAGGVFVVTGEKS